MSKFVTCFNWTDSGLLFICVYIYNDYTFGHPRNRFISLSYRYHEKAVELRFSNSLLTCENKYMVGVVIIIIFFHVMDNFFFFGCSLLFFREVV